MKDGKLEVGDKVYSKYYGRNSVRFSFSKVERLTKTLAILSSGTRLVNEGKIQHYSNNEGFLVYGAFDWWHLENEEVLKEYKEAQHQSKVNSWFSNQKFTYEQKQQIYNLFNTETAQ